MFQSVAVSKKIVRMLKQSQSNTTKTFSSFDKEINKMNNSLFFFDLFSKQKDTVLYETYKTSVLLDYRVFFSTYFSFLSYATLAAAELQA